MFGRSKEDNDSTVKDKAKGAAKLVAAREAQQAVTSDEDDEKSGGKGKLLALLLAGVGALYVLKKRRETERPLPRP